VWAARVTNRAEFGDIVRNLLHEIEQLDVDVRTGVAATAEAVRAERPDAVIVATGSTPDRNTIPGSDGPEVAAVTDILSGAVKPGKRVLLIDRLGFHEATSTAEYMAEQGCEVEVVTPTLYVGQDLGVTLDLENWYRQARRLGITCTPNYSVLSIEDGVVTALHNYSGQMVAFPKVDTVVLAIHRRADDSLYDALDSSGFELHRAGDCVAPRRAHAAIIEGEIAGRAV
jgi:2,4-dienoyl-CoA reductase (NADPH2)